MQRHMEETRLRGTAQQVSIFFLFFFYFFCSMMSLFFFPVCCIMSLFLLWWVLCPFVVGFFSICFFICFLGMYVSVWGMYVSFWGMYMSFWGMYVSFLGMYVFGYVYVSLVRAIFDDAYILMPHTYLMTHTYSYSKSQLTMCQSCTC